MDLLIDKDNELYLWNTILKGDYVNLKIFLLNNSIATKAKHTPSIIYAIIFSAFLITNINLQNIMKILLQHNDILLSINKFKYIKLYFLQNKLVNIKFFDSIGITDYFDKNILDIGGLNIADILNCIYDKLKINKCSLNKDVDENMDFVKNIRIHPISAHMAKIHETKIHETKHMTNDHLIFAVV
jgi:hypothetical protein